MSARHGIVLGTIFKHHHPHDHYSLDYVGNMGGCQNSGPFLGTLNIRCLIIIGIPKGTIILTTTQILPYQSPNVDPDGDLASDCPAPLLSLTPVCWQAVAAFEFAARCAATTQSPCWIRALRANVDEVSGQVMASFDLRDVHRDVGGCALKEGHGVCAQHLFWRKKLRI